MNDDRKYLVVNDTVQCSNTTELLEKMRSLSNDGIVTDFDYTDEQVKLKVIRVEVKPEMIQDDFMGDFFLGCTNCKEPIHFPLVRNPQLRNMHRPGRCSKCGAIFNWEGVTV